MARDHHYAVTTEWTGNTGAGTSGYRAYRRDHSVLAEGKAVAIAMSSDPAFLGDSSRYNPEELLVAALSSCHMLWYLHLCSAAGIVVTRYRDRAEGVMAEEAGGAGQFSTVTLKPEVGYAPGTDIDKADALHHEAHAKCFIARSVNFPVTIAPVPLDSGNTRP